MPSGRLERRIPITWTACDFGGHRPWFVYSVSPGGRYCGRRVAVLYSAAELFACRCCSGLAYASQREPLYSRDLEKAQKIRMRLGGSPKMSERFPDNRKACTGGPMIGYATATTSRRSVR